MVGRLTFYSLECTSLLWVASPSIRYKHTFEASPQDDTGPLPTGGFGAGRFIYSRYAKVRSRIMDQIDKYLLETTAKPYIHLANSFRITLAWGRLNRKYVDPRRDRMKKRYTAICDDLLAASMPNSDCQSSINENVFRLRISPSVEVLIEA